MCIYHSAGHHFSRDFLFILAPWDIYLHAEAPPSVRLGPLGLVDPVFQLNFTFAGTTMPFTSQDFATVQITYASTQIASRL